MDNQKMKSTIEKIMESIFEHGSIATVYLVLYDILILNLSYLLALWIRFDCHYRSIPVMYIVPWRDFTAIYTIFSLIIFKCFKMYRSVWKYASYNELANITMATVITGLFHAAGITILFKRMPITYYAFGIMLQFTFIVTMRFSYRFLSLEKVKKNDNMSDICFNRVMLIGAGEAGRMILRDMNITRETNDRVVCIIDDNPKKQKRCIDGIEIVGGRDCILSAVQKYKIDKIFMAIPAATAEEKRDILNICKETGCELKNLPAMYQLVNGEVTTKELKEVAIEDLLGREPIKVNMDEIYFNITGKVILVTGVGSIGSEICRQIAAHNPKQLVMFDIYENNLYDIQQELIRKYPDMNLVAEIGSVRDSRRLNQLFEKYRPEMVYHAAAHKHVPLMEGNPNEAIKNNAIGTYKTAYAAMMNGCKKFVLISTDKAVNPTNVMGATKRMCEMIIQSFDKMIKEGKANQISKCFEHLQDEDGKIMKFSPVPRDVKTEYVAVRFGNVLGSNGSVIPLFKKQIEEGGPVTVTHPDIIRYFMTIPEAVSLVLQAGAYAKGGEIFILDMGNPVKIDDLARNLIKLSGLKPDIDIQLEYIGLRPGEKLYEEKLMAEEGLRKTPNKLIHIASPVKFDSEEFFNKLGELMDVVYEEDIDIRMYLKDIVKTYISEELAAEMEYSEAHSTEMAGDKGDVSGLEVVGIGNKAIGDKLKVQTA